MISMNGVRFAIFCLAVYVIERELPCLTVDCACLTPCTCTPSSRGQAVVCGTGLTSVPTNIPADTQLLSITQSVPGQLSNVIATISSSDFRSTPQLERLQLRKCGLQTIQGSAFTSLNKLVSLDLSSNNLKHISRQNLVGIPQLQLLDLTGNTGCSLDSDTFNDLPNLRTLRLARIGFKTLGTKLAKLSALQDLDLHGNDLFRLESVSFSPLSNLKHLDVTHNDLRGIQEDLKPLLTTLKSLNLYPNPWRCNCALIWLKKSLPTKFLFPTHNGGGSVVCNQPTNLSNKDLINVPDADMHCLPAKVISCSQSVSVREGGAFTISCSVEGDPFPDVIWVSPTGVNVSHEVMSSVQNSSSVDVQLSIYSAHNGQWKIVVESYKSIDSKAINVDVLTTTTAATTATTTTAARKTTVTTVSNNLKSTTQQQIIPGRTPIRPSPIPGQITSKVNGQTPSPVTSGPIPGQMQQTTGKSGQGYNPNSPLTLPGFTQPQTFQKPRKPSSSLADSGTNFYIAIGAIVMSAILCFIGMTVFGVAICRTRAKARVSFAPDIEPRDRDNEGTVFIVTTSPGGTKRFHQWTH